MNVTIESAPIGSDLRALLPLGGRIVRKITSSAQRPWYLMELDAPFSRNGLHCRWLLLRSSDEGGFSLRHAKDVNVLKVGADPVVGDGFDESGFASLGIGSAKRRTLSHRQRVWIGSILFVLCAAYAFVCYWYWNDPDPMWRFITRALFRILPEILGHMK